MRRRRRRSCGRQGARARLSGRPPPGPRRAPCDPAHEIAAVGAEGDRVDGRASGARVGQMKGLGPGALERPKRDAGLAADREPTALRVEGKYPGEASWSVEAAPLSLGKTAR